MSYDMNELMAELNNINAEISRLDDLYAKMQAVIERPVYVDFNYKRGDILGILRSIMQNPKYRNELLGITNLTPAHIVMYTRVGGNLPYKDKRTGEYVEGRMMDAEKLRPLVAHAAKCMGIEVSEEDLADITNERFKELYAKAKKEALATVGMQDDNVQYEE